MTYQLIAFDMDGTLLSSEKHVLPSSAAAMREAAEAGHAVAICTGRVPAMVTVHADEFEGVRYAICASGATLYDLERGEILGMRSIDPELVARVRDAAAGERYMLDVFCGYDFFYSAAGLAQMERFGIHVYRELFEKTGQAVDDEWGAALTHAIQKLDLHFLDRAARDRVTERLRGLNLELAFSEGTTLEVSPGGVNKGVGLLDLAEKLGVPREATIAVGDSYNDLPMLRVAGLAVAMGNANEAARAAADVVVADNDHDGCAEAIRRYLLAAGNDCPKD